MAPFIRLTPGTVRLAPETRLIKAAEAQTFVEARELLAEVRQQAEALRAEAAAEYERQKARGYADGLNAARMDMAARMLETAGRTVDYLASIEDRVVALVMTALRKILGEFDDTERTLRVVRHALQVVRNQPSVTIRVHPAQAGALQERLSALLAGYSGLGQVEVSPDPRLDRDGCILETEIGVVEASLEVQLRALEKALKSRLRRATET